MCISTIPSVSKCVCVLMFLLLFAIYLAYSCVSRVISFCPDFDCTEQGAESVDWSVRSLSLCAMFLYTHFIPIQFVYVHMHTCSVYILRCMRARITVCRIYINIIIGSFIHDIGFYLFTLVFWLGLLFFSLSVYSELLFSLLFSCVL